MSRAFNRKKKEKRRALDAQNPERIRIRRMIRQGRIPRLMFGKYGDPNLPGHMILRMKRVVLKAVKDLVEKQPQKKIWVNAWPVIDTFRLLTAKKEGAL